MLIKRVHDELLWETRSPSFTAWVREACPFGYSTAFEAYRAVGVLRDIPDADLAKISKPNLATLAQLSTAVRNEPAVLEAAKTMSSDNLVDHVKANHPNQHLEHSKVLRFPCTETEAAGVERSIEKAIMRGAANRTEALIDICVNYEADIALEELAKMESQ